MNERKKCKTKNIEIQIVCAECGFGVTKYIGFVHKHSHTFECVAQIYIKFNISNTRIEFISFGFDLFAME